jgi:4-aminobutyrate aminotransferase-like enzyme
MAENTKAKSSKPKTSTKKLADKFFGKYPGQFDIEIVSSEGSSITDSIGKKYIDFLGGWNVGNVGWGNKEIEKAIKNFSGPNYVHPSFLYKPWAELAEKLAEITPGKLQVCYRATGGSEAVEAALQIAMLYTGRHKFVSIEGSYHGNTIGSLSVGASDNEKQFKNLMSGCYKINPPLDKKALGKVETLLKKRDIAAFIMEPIICNLGVMVPEQQFMKGLRKLCSKYGTLLIMDEVATGFGRTGKMFGIEHFDVEPDIMCFSKGISGGYAGIGAAITTPKIAKAIEEDFKFFSTYGWHPLSVEATMAYLNYIEKHKAELLDNVMEVSQLFETRLNQMQFKHGHDLNIKGLAIGLKLHDADYAKKVQEKCFKSGLIIRAEGESLAMFPALNISKKTVWEGLEILEDCL